MKQVFTNIAIAVIAFLGISSCFAQGQPPNGFGKPNNTFDFYSAPVRPGSKGLFSACYWLNLGTPRVPVQYPIIGMPVVLTSNTVCGSGGHAHDASCSGDRPQMELAINSSVVPSINAITDMNGCVTAGGIFPEYAGYVTMSATNADYSVALETPAGAAVAFIASSVLGRNFLLQDYGPPGTTYMSTDPNNPVPLAQYVYDSSLNNINYSPQDYAHGADIDRALPTTIQATKLASGDYEKESGEYVGYDDKLIIWRMSLPWGGAADNGVQQTITSMANGDWDNTTPYNAGNAYGVEVEITNPSLAPYAPEDGVILDEHAAIYAIWVFRQRGCTMGQFQPSFDIGVANTPMVGTAVEAFWSTHQTIHFECDPSFRKTVGR